MSFGSAIPVAYEGSCNFLVSQSGLWRSSVFHLCFSVYYNVSGKSTAAIFVCKTYIFGYQ